MIDGSVVTYSFDEWAIGLKYHSPEAIHSHLPLLLSHPPVVGTLHQVALAKIGDAVANFAPMIPILGLVAVLLPPARHEVVSDFLLLLRPLHRLVS